MSTIKEGQLAPDFTLPDGNGKMHNLSDYKGKWVLLYFYPKDDTPGCTKEACGIRDDFFGFEKLNAAVLGVSADSPESHKKFALKYKLPFVLLSDEKKEIIKKYGVLGEKKIMGRKFIGIKRTSFLINPKGKILKVYKNVDPKIHSKEVLNDLKEFSERNS